VALGAALAGMNSLIYLAIDEIPIGVAVTVELLGPLAVAAAGIRRPVDVLWVLLAIAGVALLGMEASGDLSVTGLLLAAGAAAFWALYIVASARLGPRVRGVDGLSAAMLVAAVIVVPLGAAPAASAVLEAPWLLAVFAAVALLTSSLPYALEFVALKTMPSRVFGVLSSLGPAVAALAGVIVLQQLLSPAQLAAVALVTAASVGVVATARGQTPTLAASPTPARLTASPPKEPRPRGSPLAMSEPHARSTDKEGPMTDSKRAFRQIDVFGQDTATGNPVAVVLDAEGLDDEQMRRFSAWTNLSECTFVLSPTVPGADYRTRIFSLNTEIPFAGHPTLGTARAWLDNGGTPATPGVVIQQCGAGLIPVRIDGNYLAFAAPPRLRTGPVDPTLLSKLIDILGIHATAVIDAEWLDNGPGWVGLHLTDADTVLGLRPDASAHPGRWDIGVIGLHKPGSPAALEVRAFFTEGGEPLREDPVTGSLNAAAAEWLINTGRIETPYIAAQGAAVRRNGRIYVSIEDEQIWVGGHTSATITGTVAI
jgi:PhzF family phenazine biosynthesis protein